MLIDIYTGSSLFKKSHEFNSDFKLLNDLKYGDYVTILESGILFRVEKSLDYDQYNTPFLVLRPMNLHNARGKMVFVI